MADHCRQDNHDKPESKWSVLLLKVVMQNARSEVLYVYPKYDAFIKQEMKGKPSKMITSSSYLEEMLGKNVGVRISDCVEILGHDFRARTRTSGAHKGGKEEEAKSEDQHHQENETRRKC